VESMSYYGAGYQDMQHRKPNIGNAWRLLNWKPTVGLEQSVEQTLDFFLREAARSGEFEDRHGMGDDEAQALSSPSDNRLRQVSVA